MIKKDLHIHSSYCDGNDTVEEIIKHAISLKMETVGILAHSYTPFDEEPCIKEEDLPKFKSEVNSFKVKYQDKINVLLGLERDYFSSCSNLGFDYIIGSVHYLKFNSSYFAIDDTIEKLMEGCKKYFNDDYYALCEEYYSLVSDVINKTSCSIIGHFDLVTKFNEIYHLWDEKDPRYIASWKKAVDALIPYHIPFEINLGGITRGKKTTPYPSFEIIEYIKNKGGTFILSSDSHNKENILKDFSKYEYLLK